MATTVNERPNTVTIDDDDPRVISVGAPGPIGPTGATGDAGPQGDAGPAGADGADGADGVGPIDVTGIQNAVVVSENETLKALTDATGYWDDALEPFMGKNIDVASGRIDYDYDNSGIAFADNARYDVSERVCFNYQMPHSWVEGTGFRWHLHWMQQYAAFPNVLIEWRIWRNGEAPSSWTKAQATTQNVFTYSSGTILQISKWDEIDLAGCNVSDIVQVHFYRDTNNGSGVGFGADPYTGALTCVYADAHIMKNSVGSIGEYDKDGI